MLLANEAYHVMPLLYFTRKKKIKKKKIGD
jgi:hypothetical protein